MRPTHGEIIAYSDYLAQTAQARVDPLLEMGRDRNGLERLAGQSPRHAGAGRRVRARRRRAGAVAGDPGAGARRDHRLAPALVLASVHRPVRPGGVQPGASSEQRAASEGDVVFVPAWCPHAIGNPDAGTGLILLRLQNPPQHAGAGLAGAGRRRRHAPHLRRAQRRARRPSPRRRHEVRIDPRRPDAPERYSPRCTSSFPA